MLYFVLLNSFSIFHSLSLNQSFKNNFFPFRTVKLPSHVIKSLSSRSMRIHHYLFHSIRNLWNSLSPSQKTVLFSKGWAPPRPALDKNKRYYRNNNSGEDFLYMHRKMIEDVNNMLSQGNYTYGKRVVGWTRIPAPNDQNFPVPPVYAGRNSEETRMIANSKTDEFYYNNLLPVENNLKNPNYLRNLTLGQLGAMIEFEIHNPMHLRWSSKLLNYREEVTPFWDVDKIGSKWDSPFYDWMFDSYSSHVNVVFWKLHGWIDDKINEWQMANNVDTIHWKGTWMGPPGDDGHSVHHHIKNYQSFLFVTKSSDPILKENKKSE